MSDSTHQKTSDITEFVRTYLSNSTLFHDRPTVERADETDAAVSEGFRDGCEDYYAEAFTVIADGRTYYITIEDITPKE